MLDPVIRRLARDQWVRLHGTPRVTVLVGGARGREIWSQWLALSSVAGTLLEAAAGGPGGRDGADGQAGGDRVGDAIDAQIRSAVARAIAEPAHPVAVLVTAEAAQRWRAGRRDRLAAMVDEGWLAVPEEVGERGSRPGGTGGEVGRAGDGRGGGHADGSFRGDTRGAGGGTRDDARGVGDPGFSLDARSLAEATLFDALEATLATAGRFRLNESLSVRFGPVAAEVDLLSRGDRIAIEIDRVHHFADLERYRRDRRKDLLLQTHGFVVVRLLAEEGFDGSVGCFGAKLTSCS
jgi:very-short-patch-repair endonuclease